MAFCLTGCWSIEHLFLAGVPGNIDLLHLRTSFDDLHNLGVSQISLNFIFAAAAIRPMNLDGVIGCFESRPGSKILGDGSLSDSTRVTHILQVTSLIAKQSRGFDVSNHLGQHLLDQLMLSQIRAKLPANICVAQTSLHTGLAYAHTAPGNRVSSIIQ